MYGLEIRENVWKFTTLPKQDFYLWSHAVSLCKDVQIDMNVCPLSLLAGFALWFETADFPSLQFSRLVQSWLRGAPFGMF
jgi:hypothetical protein